MFTKVINRNFRRRASKRQLTAYETEKIAIITKNYGNYLDNKVIASTAGIAEAQRSNERLPAALG